MPKPRVVRARRWNISLVWLVPAVAIGIAASMLIRSVYLTGPRIEIEFKSADGVEANKTEVRYKEVVIGHVQTVTLADDGKLGDKQIIPKDYLLRATRAGFQPRLLY